MSDGGPTVSAASSLQQPQRQYSGMSTSASSKSLSDSLRQPPMDQQLPPQSTRDAPQYTQRHSQEQSRPHPAHRGNSIDSLNLGQLNLNDGRPRRPSQPAASSSYMSPGSDIRRPDSRSQHNASPYSQHSTPAAAYAAEYQATHHSQHPAYAQRLSYDDNNVDRNSELAYADPQQQTYGGQDYYANSGQYAPSTSQQPYNPSNPASVRYSDGYTEESAQAYNPYFAQGQPQYDAQGQLQYDQNAAYYAQNDQYGYDQYGYDQAGPSQQSYNNQTLHYAGSNNGAYGAHPQQAYPGQSYGTEYPIDPPRAASGSFSQGLPANVTPLNRNKTTVSAKSSLSIDKSQSTQPITKQAVDDYRNRIKSDPDPETQFNFARFLIEAARRLAVAAQQGSVDDAKSVKKYRDALLQEAIKLVKRLATQGSGLGKPAYADAQFFLANCLGHGALGLSVDHEKAYNLYVQASKQNHPAATYRTAVCNEVGAGTRRDAARAVLFYRKASALGDTAGMYKLGMILLNGLLGQQKNPREAVIWLKKAAAQADEENPHALHELGSLYEKPVEYMQNGQPVPSPVVRDEALARDFYTQAAQLGHAPSQCKLGACYEYGNLTCPVDPRRSIAWYTRAAEKGHAESELALSGWYLTGSPEVLKPSDSEAYLWARRAANKGLSKAEYAVGYYSEVGIGVKADLEEAKMWYLRAAASGNRRAMQRLSELKKMGNRKAQQGARPTRQQAEKECIIM